MARRKSVRPTERGERRTETAAVAAYLTALRAPKVPARSRATLEKRRAQIEQWIATNRRLSVRSKLRQQRLDIDAQLAQIDQASRLPELEDGVREGGSFVGQAQPDLRGGAARGGSAGPCAQTGWAL
jgi:hypothetical protein